MAYTTGSLAVYHTPEVNESFCVVQALLSYIASPLTDNQVPRSSKRSWKIGIIVPAFVGPTFIRILP